MNYEAIQYALDELGGANADFGFFYRDDGSKVYTCSIRLLSGNLRYGTGSTVETAHTVALKNQPIRSNPKQVAA